MQHGIGRRSSHAALLALAMLAGAGGAGRAFAAAGDAAVDAPRAEQAATIVLAGDLGSDAELGLLLRELLGRRRVEVTLRSEPRFAPDTLFADEQGPTFVIFIARRGPHEARLYFRAPGGERFLVRRLKLPTGLDAVGREAIGQVVESSTEALLDAAQGVTREQATREIADDTPAPVPEASARASPLRAARASEPKPAASRWEPRLRARYAALFQGQDLGWRHGPGLGLGFLYGSGVLFGAELGGERFFEQAFRGPELDGRVDASDAYLSVDAGVELGGGHRVLLALGPRLELSRARGEAKDPTITPVAAHGRVDWGLRLELGYEWTSRHLVVGMAVAGDVAFVRTSYDLAVPGGEARSVSEVPALRPGAVLTLAVR